MTYVCRSVCTYDAHYVGKDNEERHEGYES